MPDLLPTHHCFDDAPDFIHLLLRAGRREWRKMFIAHGICHAIPGNGMPGMKDGQPYAHAWCEGPRKKVYVAGMLRGSRVFLEGDREEFYSRHKIVDVTVYTVRQWSEMNNRTGNYGPWVERYLALCRPKENKTATLAAFLGAG